MNARHTPGPWYLGSSRVCIWAPDGSPVADAFENNDRPPEEYEANARLIADAPELLDALKDCVQWLMAFAKGTGNEIIRETDRYQKYLEVIARAEGRQQ